MALGGKPMFMLLRVLSVIEPMIGLVGVVGITVPAPPSEGGKAAPKLLGISVWVRSCLSAVMLRVAPTESLSVTL